MTGACDTQNSRASSQISAHYILTYRLIDVRYYIYSLRRLEKVLSKNRLWKQLKRNHRKADL